MIAFIIRTCDVLNVDLNLQYNESLDPSKHHEDVEESGEKQQAETAGISTISITGMTCSACTTTIEKALLEVRGVESALVSLHFQEARVFHATDLDTKTLVSAVEDVGYEAVPGERAAPQKIETLQQQDELQSLSQCLSKLSVISTIILVLGDGLDYAGMYPVVDAYQMCGLRQMVLFVLAATAAFRYSKWIFGSAFDQAKRFRVNMHSLIGASTLLGLSLSVFNVFMTTSGRSATYYNTVVGVLFIVTAGRYVDLLSGRQATNTFIGLYSLLEETSSVKLLNGKVRLLSLNPKVLLISSVEKDADFTLAASG
jgi:Cu+-exporting ATPase